MVVVYEDDTCTIYEENGKLRIVIKRDENGYFKQVSKQAKEFVQSYKKR